jgi:hypothetical protein
MNSTSFNFKIPVSEAAASFLALLGILFLEDESVVLASWLPDLIAV